MRSHQQHADVLPVSSRLEPQTASTFWWSGREQRFSSTPDYRLACQIRPQSSVGRRSRTPDSASSNRPVPRQDRLSPTFCRPHGIRRALYRHQGNKRHYRWSHTLSGNTDGSLVLHWDHQRRQTRCYWQGHKLERTLLFARTLSIRAGLVRSGGTACLMANGSALTHHEALFAPDFAASNPCPQQ